MLTPLRRLPAALACAAALVSCGPALPDPAPEAEKLREASLEQLGAGKHCTAQRKATEPDLFGWDSGSRGKVKATAEQGLVVVHFEQRGCDIAIAVLNCTSTKVAYRYTPRHALQSRFAENDADLYAHFPVAVAELRGRLGADRAIRADYRMEGIDMIPIGTVVEPSDLKGSECDEATHVVRAIHRGAFAVAAAARSELSAGGGTLFEASAKQKLGVFDGDGFQEACDGARQRGTRASGCDEPLRIELQPIQRSRPPVSLAAVPEAVPVPAPVPPPEPVPTPPPPERPRAVRAPAARSLIGLKLAAEPGPEEAPPVRASSGVCSEGMVRIRGGSFAPSYADDHPVTVDRFCLDRTEVTVAAYAQCPSCRPPLAGGRCNARGMGKDDHPQNCVSWHDAATYCAWAGKRLPTEAEWELAARGGGVHQLWPWGDTPPGRDHACFNRWSVEDRGTCPVGHFPEGSFGLADMAGNVWEWVADWYGPFAPGDPRATPAKGAGRVMRGGAWTSSSFTDIGTSSRAATWPTNRDDYLGFRCAS